MRPIVFCLFFNIQKGDLCNIQKRFLQCIGVIFQEKKIQQKFLPPIKIRSKVQGPRSKVQGPRSKVLRLPRPPRPKPQSPKPRAHSQGTKAESLRSKVQRPEDQMLNYSIFNGRKEHDHTLH